MDQFITFVFIVTLGICALFLTPAYLKSRERMRLIELVRTASEKGAPLPPEALSVLTAEPKQQRPSHIRDIRRGVVLLAFAVAFEIIALCIYVAGYTAERADSMPEAEDFSEIAAFSMGFAGFGAIPFCIGFAFLMLGLVGRKTETA